jgi:SsrA-binding protein
MAGTKLIAQNKKARHDYELERKLEAGIALQGGEVKSVKAGHVSINEAYVTLRGGEAWLLNAHIKAYQPGQGLEQDPTRTRKLLLKREEINSLLGQKKGSGRTVIPTRIYLKHGRVKLEVAVGKGKRQYDKRASLKKREQEREAAQAVKRTTREA